MSGLKGKVFLLGAEAGGCGDDNLGFRITTDVLESLVNREDRAVAIICWNTAVRLLAATHATTV